MHLDPITQFLQHTELLQFNPNHTIQLYSQNSTHMPLHMLSCVMCFSPAVLVLLFSEPTQWVLPTSLDVFVIITMLSARCEAPGDAGGICPIIAIIGAISHEGSNQASYKQYRSQTNIFRGDNFQKTKCSDFSLLFEALFMNFN